MDLVAGAGVVMHVYTGGMECVSEGVKSGVVLTMEPVGMGGVWEHGGVVAWQFLLTRQRPPCPLVYFGVSWGAGGALAVTGTGKRREVRPCMLILGVVTWRLS